MKPSLSKLSSSLTYFLASLAPAVPPPRRSLAGLLLLAAAAADADSLRYDSGERRVALLELYTSEGCSSCPPADRWLNGLLDDPRLWRELVPVAFHVDYWDYIGWPDRFAAPIHGARQRGYAAYGLLRSVYTPGLVLAGREWRGWFVDRSLPELSSQTLPLAAGALRLDVDVAADELRVAAAFVPLEDAAIKRPLRLHMALLGFGLHSEVDAGENRGRRLRHDFVVLRYRRQALPPTAKGYAAHSDLSLASLPAPDTGPARRAIAAWVSSGIDPSPLQTAAGWLP